jgi:hypothetical protein
MKSRLICLFVAILFGSTIGANSTVNADEGMYPISMIADLNLNEHGLEIAPDDVYNPDKVSLIDGICRVNGCTGSFVSPKGLIITNHHCAYRAIQSASTTDNDYLKDGFFSQSMDQEIQAKGYVVRITESYSDVSDKVLDAATEGMSFLERSKAIEKRRKEIEKQAEIDNPGTRAEVAEMFTGKTYVLFLYTFIKDVRLVFAPPSSVGAFGGDVDNWEWPRHTGDFSFMRAYVGPDGKSADYSPDNIPYTPKKFIPVSPAGANEGDFVFLLGYPGRTARHKTASFLKFEQNVRLPFVVDLYQWQISTMQAAGKGNRDVALKHSSREKSLANVEKRSRGQLKGLIRKSIVETRSEQERKLQSFIDSDPTRKEKFGSLLTDIESVYAEMTEKAPYEMTMANLPNACRAMNFAFTIYDAAKEREKEDLDRESAFMDRNFDRTKSRLLLSVNDWHAGTDKIMLKGIIERLNAVNASIAIPPAKDLDEAFSETKLGDADAVAKYLEMSPAELAKLDDYFMKVVVELYPEFMRFREQNKARDGKLGQLYGDLIDVKQQLLETNFVPDANATLRMTFGHVKGYSPEDAVYKSPATTLRGVIEKTTGVEPFVTPDKVSELYKQGEFGNYVHPKLDQVPVALLYDTDTTGGNSGSPIIDAKGQLVGVNFDRAFEATINDFAWNKSYSRSIGVDVRYVLWITDNVYGAKHLIEEMGIQK